MPDILYVSPHTLDVRGAPYTVSLRDYSRQLRERCGELVRRSRVQRSECRRLALQSERALRIPQPQAA